MAISSNLHELHERIARACDAAGRARSEVSLLAVSKTVESERIMEAYQAGQRAFGESRQQEAEPKVRALPDDIEWHFIGALQRNKVRKVLDSFTVIHSIDSLKLARHVDRIAAELGLKPAVFLEINVAGEASKGGFPAEGVREEITELAGLGNVELAGLMAIPPEVDEPADARPWFQKVRELRDELAESSGLPLAGLSMGMSGDFESAILEGATVIRVGSSIFGARHYS